MRRRPTTPVLELVAALALFIGPPPLLGPTIAWGDPAHAWVGGGGGILASADGGATWQVQTRAPARELVALGPGHAWALSDQGVTLRTTDGVRWRPLGVQHLLRLTFGDARTGFGLDRDDFVLKTTDSGKTWRPTGGPQRVQSICFVDTRTGWVARNGTVWTTHDAGAHWRARTLMPYRQGFPIPELSCHGNDVWIVFHSGAAAGTEGYRIFRSLDRGATWRAVFASFEVKLPMVSNYSGPISVIGAGAAVLEGSCSPCGYGSVTLVRTSNGGRTFARTTFRNTSPGPVAFVDHLRGFAVLTPLPHGLPTIYRTLDGGRTWRRVLSSELLKE